MYFEQKVPTRQFGKQIRGQHAIQGYMIDGQNPAKDVEEAEDSKQASKVNVNVTSEKST